MFDDLHAVFLLFLALLGATLFKGSDSQPSGPLLRVTTGRAALGLTSDTQAFNTQVRHVIVRKFAHRLGLAWNECWAIFVDVL